ncbi:MAG: nucleotidyltransferase family protein [Candidatus Levyibacteriota bacterium]
MNIQQIKQKAIPLLKEAGVTRSSLFGSYARGDYNEKSDIDFLVEFPRGKTLLDLVSLERSLRDIFHKKVDVVTYKSVHPLLKEYIDKDQLPIYEKTT